MQLNQYDVVKIKAIHRQFTSVDNCLGESVPQVGDVATIVEIYEKPCIGYELECCKSDGSAKWLVTFAANDAEFEVVMSVS